MDILTSIVTSPFFLLVGAVGIAVVSVQLNKRAARKFDEKFGKEKPVPGE